MSVLAVLALLGCWHPAAEADRPDSAEPDRPLPGDLGARRVGYLLLTPERLADPDWPPDALVRTLTHVKVGPFTVREEWAGLTVLHDYDDAALRAFLQRLRDQADRYGVRMLASVGGPAYGVPTAAGYCAYVAAAADDISRETFASRAAGTLDGMCDHGGAPCFDGIDLDLRWPGQTVDAGEGCTDGGGVLQPVPDAERARDVRDLLVALRARFGLVTTTAPGSLDAVRFAWAVLPDIAATVDFLDVLAYDAVGPWSQLAPGLDTAPPGCAADTHQCGGCEVALVVARTDHAAPLHASPGATGQPDPLCDVGAALPDVAVCDPDGDGALAWDSPGAEAACAEPYVLAADRLVAVYVDALGIDPAKLDLGLPLYGRAFRNVGPTSGVGAPDAADGLHEAFAGMCLDAGYCAGGEGVPVGSCTTPEGVRACPGDAPYYWLAGFTDPAAAPDPRVVSWAQVVAACPAAAALDGLTGTAAAPCAAAGWIARYDAVAEEPWLWNAGAAQLVTFDAPRSVAAKGAWARAAGLGGLALWEVGQDDADATLLTAACRAVGEGACD